MLPMVTQQREGKTGPLIKVEYHRFEANNFCTGIAFVSKHGGVEEDDGWIVSYVHNEDANISQVSIPLSSTKISYSL